MVHMDSNRPTRDRAARQRYSFGLDNVADLNDEIPPIQEPIRAELAGSRHCSALGLSVNAYAPVLVLARTRIRAGFDPNRLIEVYRGSTTLLCFRVKLATAASNDPAGTSARLDITKSFPEPHPEKRDGLRAAGRRRLAGV